jgi:hypothetical protein
MAGFRPNHKEPQIKEPPLYRQYPTEGLRIASFAAQFDTPDIRSHIYIMTSPNPTATPRGGGSLLERACKMPMLLAANSNTYHHITLILIASYT